MESPEGAPPRGVKAEERNLKSEKGSYMENIGTYFQDISSYLPTSLKKKIPTVSSNVSLKEREDRDIITWTSFDYIEFKGKRHQCLVLAYTNGFQIWDLHEPENVREIISKRAETVKCLKLLPEPLPDQLDAFAAHRPLMALGGGKAVRLWSLAGGTMNDVTEVTGGAVNELRFRGEVTGLRASRRLLVVAQRDRIFGFAAHSMERLIAVETFPSPGPTAVVALGPRWLAVPATQLVAVSRATSASDRWVATANQWAAQIVQLGSKTWQEYNRKDCKDSQQGRHVNEGRSEETLSKPPAHLPAGVAGTVMVYDIDSQRSIAHWSAHSQPLSALAFDPTGTLLVTASTDGHNFHVFQIAPNSQPSFRHLYKLQRGLTNATIGDISFSDDSRWMAVSSTRGTTHVYPIHPLGGPVSVETHLRQGNRNPWALVSPQQPECQTLGSVSRIKQATLEDSGTGRLPLISSTSAFVSSHPFTTQRPAEKLFILTQLGILAQHQLQPRGPPPGSDMDPNTLQLKTSLLVEWDICRKTVWPEVPGNLDSLLKDSPENHPKAMKWLSNVEISTHDPRLRPLWASPQFTFKTFQKAKVERDSPMGDFHFYEKAPTVEVEVRHNDPAPFRERLPDQTQVGAAPSAPPATEDLKENLLDAINTPLQASSLEDTRRGPEDLKPSKEVRQQKELEWNHFVLQSDQEEGREEDDDGFFEDD